MDISSNINSLLQIQNCSKMVSSFVHILFVFSVSPGRYNVVSYHHLLQENIIQGKGRDSWVMHHRFTLPFGVHKFICLIWLCWYLPTQIRVVFISVFFCKFTHISLSNPPKMRRAAPLGWEINVSMKPCVGQIESVRFLSWLVFSTEGCCWVSEI